MNPFGCVFRRELVRLSRHWQIYVIRAVFLVSLLAGLVIAVQDYAAAGGSDLATLGARLMDTMTIVLAVALLLTLPALTCSMVLEEQQRDTLGVLLLTRLGARQILLQKLTSRLAYALLILIGALPFATALLVTGGVAPQQIFTAIGVFWVIALGSITIGMLTSTLCASMVGATLASYLLMIIIMPILTSIALLLGQTVYDYRQDETAAIVASTLGMLLLSVGLFVFAFAYTAGDLTDVAPRDVAVPEASPREGSRSGQLRAYSGTPFQMLLERESSMLGIPFRWLISSAILLALVTGVVLGFAAGWKRSFRSEWIDQDWPWILLIGCLVYGIVGILLQASGNLARERQQLTFQFLMISPVSTWRLVVTKLIGLLIPAAVGLFMMVFAILPHLGWFAWHTESSDWVDRWPGLLLWCVLFYGTWMATAWLLVTGSLWISYRQRSGLLAAAMSAVLLGSICFGIVTFVSTNTKGGWSPWPPDGQLDSLASCAVYCSLNVLAGSLFLARFTVLLNRDRNLGDIA